jgi:hypothetical protein
LLFGRYGWDPYWEGWVQCDVSKTTWGKQNPTFAGMTFSYEMATPDDIIGIGRDCARQVTTSDCFGH